MVENVTELRFYHKKYKNDKGGGILILFIIWPTLVRDPPPAGKLPKSSPARWWTDFKLVFTRHNYDTNSNTPSPKQSKFSTRDHWMMDNHQAVRFPICPQINTSVCEVSIPPRDRARARGPPDADGHFRSDRGVPIKRPLGESNNRARGFDLNRHHHQNIARTERGIVARRKTALPKLLPGEVRNDGAEEYRKHKLHYQHKLKAPRAANGALRAFLSVCARDRLANVHYREWRRSATMRHDR